MSYSTFRRMWIKVVGEPPQKVLISMRINRAKLLLVETQLTISEISNRVGIQDPLYFQERLKMPWVHLQKDIESSFFYLTCLE